MELRGLEPLTPTLPVWCATSCAIAPCSLVGTQAVAFLSALAKLPYRLRGDQIPWTEARLHLERASNSISRRIATLFDKTIASVANRT